MKKKYRIKNREELLKDNYVYRNVDETLSYVGKKSCFVPFMEELHNDIIYTDFDDMDYYTHKHWTIQKWMCEEVKNINQPIDKIHEALPYIDEVVISHNDTYSYVMVRFSKENRDTAELFYNNIKPLEL